jgi:hypothetical protein
MSELIGRTVFDLRNGRTTWRVMGLLSIPAAIAGIIASL